MGSGTKAKYSLKQNEALLLNALNYCLKFNIDNPVLKHVSFTYARLSGDKRFLNVYVDTFDRSKINQILKHLNEAKGLFRSTIAQKTSLYKAPQINFYADQTIDNNLKIEEILAKIKGE
ncbi:MAG: 30S ribosome-binding factor RbfA [Mycoplasma sp.]